ncbi:MAG TPA: crotonase/enoyl-CoA hydratase family protein [Acidimicrobiia bacterium]|nr:crotonase/enoyl-CoA hydratase family protein [Acidimicrobiia bacterium]
MVVEQERRGQIALVTLNRPEARNAINGEVAQAMEATLDELEADDDVRALVLTGAGTVFCAGADLKMVARGGGIEASATSGGFAGFTKRDFPKPIIAAVNGPAVAGGFEIVLACDLVVAAEEAVFGIPEVKRGLFAAAGGLIRLPKRVALPLAMELALTGETIDAQRAYTVGLVNRVVPRARVVDDAIELAERIAGYSQVAVRNARRMVREAPYLSEADAWARSDELAIEVFRRPDAIEGASAFSQKRGPTWND